MGPENRYPRSFLVRKNGRVIAHAQADPRTIHTLAGDLAVLALCRVCTDPSVRGKRLGQALSARRSNLWIAECIHFRCFKRE